MIYSDMAWELFNEDKLNSRPQTLKRYDIDIDETLSKKFGKPKGKYITVESDAVLNGDKSVYVELIEQFCRGLKEILPNVNKYLVVGLGNPHLSADSLGSEVVKMLSVRSEESARTLLAICPNVYGVTGIESYDIIISVVERLEPDCVIVIDSLASASSQRLATAFQICSSGITPGSGVDNARKRLDKESLGVDTISIGIPLVVHARTLLGEGCEKFSMNDTLSNLIVTPKDIDILVKECAFIIASSINKALFDEVSLQNSFLDLL